jgi:hypothetical protein
MVLRSAMFSANAADGHEIRVRHSFEGAKFVRNRLGDSSAELAADGSLRHAGGGSR